MQTNKNILQIENLSKFFGGLAAVSNCSLQIKKGSITGIIGPNGSGKTTLFNLIAGNIKPSNGNVLFHGEDITGIPSYELFSKGLLRTFQIAHEFFNLTVLENLMMVPGNQSGELLINALLKPKLVKGEEKIIKQKALEVIEFLLSAVMVKFQGGKNSSAFLSILGAIIGAIIGSFILPIIGTFLGLIIGSYLVTYYNEKNLGKNSQEATQIAISTTLGYLIGKSMKSLLIAIFVLYLII